MVLCGIVDEEILAALGYLPEYPTCSKAVCWHDIWCAVNFAWPIEPSLLYGSTPCRGLWFLCNWIGWLARAHPLSSDEGFSESRRIPEFCLGFPCAFHRTVLMYYGRQVSKVCYVTTTYGVEDSLVRAIFAKE